MDTKKIAAFVEVVLAIADAGLPPLIGGYKAVAALFGHDLTKEEQDAIEVAVLVDARRRLAEGQLMARPD